MSTSKLRLALIQMAIGETKSKNVARAVQLIKEAAGGGAQLVALPECFNSPYGINYFPKYAETIPGESTDALGVAAKKFGVYVVGGSIPERDGDKLYNTCTVWGPQGNMIAKHRKIHLFDINIPGAIAFRESDCLSPGSQLTAFDLPNCKLYVGTISPARDTSSSYIAWGHSSIVNPWGEVVATSEEEEAIVYADLDLDYVDKVRQMIPLRNQRRSDLYEINIK